MTRSHLQPSLGLFLHFRPPSNRPPAAAAPVGHPHPELSVPPASGRHRFPPLIPLLPTYHRGRTATGALCAIAYGKCNEEEDKRGRRDAAPREREARTDAARWRGGKGGKWWKITHAAVMGSDGTHVGCCSRSASATSEDCAVQQQPEGGGRGGGAGRVRLVM